VTDVNPASKQVEMLVENMERAIIGKTEVVRLVVVCLLAEGHLLIEDVPGVAKTSIARALAASLDASWNRIQFTPDLLPTDVTGVNVYNQRSGDFEFRSGAVFANVVVADEINRASPKTQSALLEVMEERRVTVDAEGHDVPRPFMVVATQNPVEMDGTYALPEAQLDRFLMRISVGYPDPDAERRILEGHKDVNLVERLQPVLTSRQVQRLITATMDIRIDPSLNDYVVAIANETRRHPSIVLGASPRASLALVRAGRAHALVQGRSYLTPGDIKAIAPYVLAHRMIVTADSQIQGESAGDLVRELLDSVPVPQPAGR
jgi:MoxR-like ATPase